MSLLDALRFAFKGFTSNNKKIYLLILRKKSNEILDVTDSEYNIIKEVIKSEREKHG